MLWIRDSDFHSATGNILVMGIRVDNIKSSKDKPRKQRTVRLTFLSFLSFRTIAWDSWWSFQDFYCSAVKRWKNCWKRWHSVESKVTFPLPLSCSFAFLYCEFISQHHLIWIFVTGSTRHVPVAFTVLKSGTQQFEKILFWFTDRKDPDSHRNEVDDRSDLRVFCHVDTFCIWYLFRRDPNNPVDTKKSL